jgi:dihydroorotase
MLQLTQAGCIGFGQAEVPIANTQIMLRALQYAHTFGYTVWLRPQELYLGKGVAASGSLATRMGLSGVPVAAETIALHTIFELVRATQARVHLCRLSSAAGVALVRQAKVEGLPISCDVSINSLHLTDVDLGYFDSRMRLNPPLRQQRDRAALRQALQDGTIDALVSDHTPVDEDAKALPFAQSEPGATGLELLLSLVLKWAQDDHVPLLRALQVVTTGPSAVLGGNGSAGSHVGALMLGEAADVCVFNPATEWVAEPAALVSQGRHTPFSGYALQGKVRATLVAGRIAYQVTA